jgi:DNA recombination protein RmuC
MVDRIRYMVEPMAKMGKSLGDAVDSYNQMVKSAESRLIPAAQRMRGLGGAQRAKSLPELASVNEPVSQLNEAKWGAGPDNPLPEGISEILELEEFEGEL